MRITKAAVALIILTALALSGCSSKDKQQGFSVKKARAVGSAEGITFPDGRLIASAGELESYLEEIGERLDVSAARDELAGCDEKYFKEHSLAAIALQEPNSGVTHTVDGVDLQKTEITVSVTRHLPDYMTASVMTQWLIFVELPAQSGNPEIKVELNTKSSE